MKNLRIAIIVIIFAVACLIAPFYFGQATRSLILDGATIVSALATLLTLLIAVLLFNRFGIEGSLLEKQTNAVFDLLSALKSFSVYIHNENLRLNFSLSWRNTTTNNLVDDSSLLFSANSFASMDGINTALNNVFMPKEIVVSSQELRFFSITRPPPSHPSDPPKKYLKVDVKNYVQEDPNEFYGILNKKEMTLTEYINHWNTLISTIEKWLSKNSSIKPELNI